MHKTKSVTIVTIFILVIFLLCGCAGQSQQAETASEINQDSAAQEQALSLDGGWIEKPNTIRSENILSAYLFDGESVSGFQVDASGDSPVVAEFYGTFTVSQNGETAEICYDPESIERIKQIDSENILITPDESVNGITYQRITEDALLDQMKDILINGDIEEQEHSFNGVWICDTKGGGNAYLFDGDSVGVFFYRDRIVSYFGTYPVSKNDGITTVDFGTGPIYEVKAQSDNSVIIEVGPVGAASVDLFGRVNDDSVLEEMKTVIANGGLEYTKGETEMGFQKEYMEMVEAEIISKEKAEEEYNYIIENMTVTDDGKYYRLKLFPEKIPEPIDPNAPVYKSWMSEPGQPIDNLFALLGTPTVNKDNEAIWYDFQLPAGSDIPRYGTLWVKFDPTTRLITQQLSG